MSTNLFISINENCNLDCSYCNVVKTDKKLSINSLLLAIKYFIKFFPWKKEYSIFFIWGEPLLSYNDIVNVVLFSEKLKKSLWISFKYHISTNGTLLNRQKLLFFRKSWFSVSLSLDSIEDTYSHRNFKNASVSSYAFLSSNFDLFKEFDDVLRVKMVILPSEVQKMKSNFYKIKSLGFSFINIQPAHGVLWEDERIDSFVKIFIDIKDSLLSINDGFKSSTFKYTDRVDTPKKTRCAKWTSEIFIDSYGDIFVCDAFLAFPHEKRTQFSHDNIHLPRFDNWKYRSFSDWKYCNDTILSDKTKLLDCEVCEETKACSMLCNALPINNTTLDDAIIASNFKIFRKLDII